MQLILFITVFIGVASLIGGIGMFMRGSNDQEAEDRLDVLTGARTVKETIKNESVLAQPLENQPSFLESVFSRMFNLQRTIDQAGISLSVSKFLVISAGMAAVSALFPIIAKASVLWIALAVATGGALPLLWIRFKCKRRNKRFAAMLPDALELIARALRSGQSLAAGFNQVGEEMPDPMGTEFARVFEEQNLGIPLEEALETMANRIDNLDLKFFCTAVILQRQTGGDLAEILDKIGMLIRERFKIWGQVQALTGEGRLSGIVLLAMPPVLFLVVYKLNPEYVKVLFTDEMGKMMLAGAVVMQLLGALVIRKIVNIKV